MMPAIYHILIKEVEEDLGGVQKAEWEREGRKDRVKEEECNRESRMISEARSHFQIVIGLEQTLP